MVAVITGASSGIGRALAVRMSGMGAKLVLAARRVERLRSLAAELQGPHVAVPTDVSDAAQCWRLIHDAIEHFGRIDTLVCNAGFALIRPVWQTKGEELAQLFRTNVLGAMACIESAVPIMRRQERRDGWRGQIVLVSSAAARRGLPLMGAYCATKAAQLAIAEALRVEVRDSGIAVTSVHPVLTSTELFRAAVRRNRTRPPLRPRRPQSAQHVADRIVRAIRRPRPEVWPHRGYRWLLGMATLAPRMADWVIARSLRAGPAEPALALAAPLPLLSPEMCNKIEEPDTGLQSRSAV